MPKWFDTKIVELVERTKTTKSFILEVPNIEKFSFNAGQFITLDLPIGDKRLDRWRSYSIANAPDNTNIIELVIVKVPFGKATTYLFEEIKLGDTLKMKGPGGVFCLPKQIDSNLVMICTGTGIAPFRSMIKHIYNKDIPHKNIHLIFGTRNLEGILYLDEWTQLVKTHPELRFDAALSRESYKGYQGYVHNMYLESYKNVSADTLFYLCGWQNMVDEAKSNLLKLGYDKTQIIEELYG